MNSERSEHCLAPHGSSLVNGFANLLVFAQTPFGINATILAKGNSFVNTQKYFCEKATIACVQFVYSAASVAAFFLGFIKKKPAPIMMKNTTR